MSRLIFVPQLRVSMRYTEWYYNLFPYYLHNYFDDIITLGGDDVVLNTDRSLFSPADRETRHQCKQINEYTKLDLKDDDILLLMDLSFPGIFQQYLYHKKPCKIFCFCHATSINYLDYFSKINQNYNNSKFINELSNLLLFDKVFVATNYHKNKILNYASTIFNSVKIFEDKITVLGALPITPKSEDKRIPFSEKENDIISLSRPNTQKVNNTLEKIIEDNIGVKITRKHCKSWKEYVDFINRSKILLVTSKEDTYGYQVMDAATNNCIPLAPNKLAYPEILYSEYLYSGIEELLRKIDDFLNNGNKGPYLRNIEKIFSFYDNLAVEMLG